jgi:proteasome lid subunit RPN8/RPN11
MRIYWSRDHKSLIENEAMAAYPEESCGFLLGVEIAEGWMMKDVRAAKNVSPAPRTGYELDGHEQAAMMKYADANDLEIIGHYHSHPNGRRGPSPTDFVLVGGDPKFLSPAETAQLPVELQSQAVQRLPDHSAHFIVAVEHGNVLETSAWQLRSDLSGFDQIDLEFFR